jgi:divinyl protochlorophyllide a 8-vinyl-reductase
VGSAEDRLNPASGDPAEGQPVTAPAGEPVARIGPNAILRVAEALAGEPQTRAQVFTQAGLAGYLHSPPEGMVDEREVSVLHQVLRAVLGIQRARAIGRDAGLRTADYLLAHRIPRPAQLLMKLLPAPLGGRLLMRAMQGHAWTFAGSGVFETFPGRPHRMRIRGCRICHGTRSEEPLCDFYAASFERLFRVLIDRRVQVVEVECQAQGAPSCTFEVRSG